MASGSHEDLAQQVTRLERRLMRSQALSVVACLLSAVLTATAWTHAGNAPAGILRVRGLVIEDSLGHDRIVLGAPIPEPKGQRISRTTGMVIRDPAGAERFGLGLMDNGDMGLGLDAPRCTSNPCNRERINLVADGSGGAQLRFLNRKTGVPGMLRLEDDDQLYLEFLNFQPGRIMRRKIGFATDTTSILPPER